MDNFKFDFFCSHCKQSKKYREANCFTRARVKHYRRGEYLAFKGNKVRELALLVDGSITVDFVLASGVVLRSVPHSAPYPMGALALLGKENRYRVDISANEDCTVILVSRQEVEAHIMKCREFMLAFFDYSTSKVDSFVEHLTLLSQRSIAAKLAYYIFISSKDGREYEFDRSVRKVAEYLCVERPSLSRVIAALAKEGIISYDNGRGKILEPQRLKQLTE